MIIVLDNAISAADKRNLHQFLETRNLRVNEIVGEEETVLGAVGKLAIDPRSVEILPGVKRVIPISKPYKMASREFKTDNTIVEIPNKRGQTICFGGRKLAVIAGPCAVESREQMMSIAQKAALSGAVMLRGGAFKPRTSPYAFQGLGEEGVRLLREAGDAYGLPVVTEIVSAEHIPCTRDFIDMYQIGARNMQNFELLKRIGETGKPVLLKRGLSATIEEWLMAAEYLLSSGSQQVVLCERGIRTFERATRNTLDMSAIPVLRSLTHLPVIVDPSHAVGIRDKVPPMALAAVAAGADGIIVEMHCDPDHALSDGAQSLLPEQFDKLMRDISVLAPVLGREVAHIRKTAPEPLPLDKTKPGYQGVCAFSGIRGAYSEQAIGRYFGETVGELALLSFREVFEAVSVGAAGYGMVPIENSLAGSVLETYDSLFRFDDICIMAGATLRIEHSLLAIRGATLGTLKNCYSHPHAFNQCGDFLEQHPHWKQVFAQTTANAAKIVAEKGSVENAAIASGINAKYNDLAELTASIESSKHNYTRFVVIASRQHGVTLPDFPGQDRKASIIFIAKNTPGALCDCLSVFQRHALNLSRLESRPMPGEPWRYMFYADVVLPGMSREDAVTVVDRVIAELKNNAQGIRLLGIYQNRDC
ncbi:MAG: 3-deoxy-7-phosphoheptulonate synthase [Spirochaetaceae bacterium]|nr:3-deoxy-7-phosphoheptulonate synthase [Spirochaetaceae bacterium]